MEKRVQYTHSNSYTTLNEPSENTENLWITFHGMGHLSRYFIRHFIGLDPDRNYIVAPQAPSKYYQGPKFKHVGASWLTRDDTLNETKNVLNYVKAVWEQEQNCPHQRKIILGYSQGVSIATRWMVRYQMDCDVLVLHSGGIPKELVASDFHYLSESTTVQLWYGKADPYLDKERITSETARAKELFGNRLQIIAFEGGHAVNEQLITGLD